MALAIMSLYVVHKTGLADNFGLIDANGNDTVSYQALLMIALTFSGLVMLYRICQPFDVTRAITFVLSAAACLLFISVPVLGEIVFTGLGDIKLTLSQILLIIIIVQASFPISGVLIRFFDMINPADE